MNKLKSLQPNSFRTLKNTKMEHLKKYTKKEVPLFEDFYFKCDTLNLI